MWADKGQACEEWEMHRPQTDFPIAKTYCQLLKNYQLPEIISITGFFTT
jgi:hypothetical protein